jgi:hypothetical protein
MVKFPEITDISRRFIRLQRIRLKRPRQQQGHMDPAEPTSLRGGSPAGLISGLQKNF